MVYWRKAPWTLQAYVVIVLAGVALAAIIASSTPVITILFFLAFSAVFCFFLLRGVRWLWLVSVAFAFIGPAISAIEGNLTWYGIAANIVALVFLLHPATRRYFAKPEGEVSY